MKKFTENFLNFLLFNSRISFYLFLTIIFLIFLQNYIFFYFSYIFCFILILSIGMIHGSLDNLKGKQLLKIFKIKNQFYFYISYIISALAVIVMWLIFPSLTLLTFLIVASFHFGKEDSSYVLWDKKIMFPELMYFIRGSIIIIAPLMFTLMKRFYFFQNYFRRRIIS